MIKLIPIKLIVLQSLKGILPFMKAFPWLIAMLFAAQTVESYMKVDISKTTTVFELLVYSLYLSLPKFFMVLVAYQTYRFVILKDVSFDFKRIIKQKYFWIMFALYAFLVLMQNLVIYYSEFIDFTAPDSDMRNDAIIVSLVVFLFLFIYIFIRMNNIFASLALESKAINFKVLYKQTHHYFFRIFVIFIIIFIPYFIYFIVTDYYNFDRNEIIPTIVSNVISTFTFILEDIQIALIYLFLTEEKQHETV